MEAMSIDKLRDMCANSNEGRKGRRMNCDKLYEFEIQNCIKIKIRYSSAEDARRTLVENPGLYQREMMADCVISNGAEMQEIHNPEDIICDNYEDDKCGCQGCEGRDQIPFNPDSCFKINPNAITGKIKGVS